MTWRRRRHGVVRLVAGHAASHHVCKPAPSRCWPMRASRSPRSRRGARGATPRCASAPRLSCSPETLTRHTPCSRSRSAAAAISGNAGSLVLSEAELALLAMDHGRWAEATERMELARAAIDEHRLHDYAISRARLRRGGPARGPPRRPGGGGPPARAGDASTSIVHDRAAIHRRARATAARQGVLDQGRNRAPLGTCCVRSTTSCSTVRTWARSSTRSRSFARSSPRAPSRERPADRPSPRPSFGCSRTCRRTSRSARSASGCSSPATPSAPRSARSIESWASPHAPTPCSRRRRSDCSAGSRHHPPTAVPGRR